MDKQLRALIIEDSQSDTLLLLRELRQEGYVVEHRRVDNAEDMIAALESASWDIILSDFSMPGFSATAALKLVQERELDTPFIIVSGTMGEETAVEAMKAGAHDYFPKGRTARLGTAIEREVREAHEREQRRRAEEELRQTEAVLQRNVQLIQLLQRVTVAANEANSIEVALQFALEHISRFAGWSLGHVYLRAKGEQPQLTSSHVWYSADPDAFANFRDVSERIRFSAATGGLIYRVFTSGKPEWLIGIDTPAADIVRVSEAQEAGIQAIYAFPILAQHEVVAVMEFFTWSADVPDQSLLETIPHIATQVGHVIERVRSNEEIRALYNATGYLFNANSIQDLAQQIVEAVVNEFEQVDCGLLWVDLPTGQINRLARAGQYQVAVLTPMTLNGPGLVPKAMRENRIVYVPDVQQDVDYVPNMHATQSELVIPLRIRDRVMGALDLQSTERDYFNQRDKRVLGAFAERAAAALEIVRLYEAINRHAAELELRVDERTQELQKAKERVETILNNSSDAIILVNTDGTIQQTNPHFMETFGYEYDELFGQSLSQVVLLEADGDLPHVLAGIVSSQTYLRLETLVRRKDGSTFPADAAFAAFASNHEVEIVCSLRDISEQKQLEQELRLAFEQQKELADLKSRFISTVSHEYRTPLTIIMMSSSMLKMYDERLTLDEKQDHLTAIQTQVERLTALLDDVLEIGRADAIKAELILESLSIADMCREVVLDFQQINPDRQIEFHLVGEAAPMTADDKLLRQIISNLVSNAVKYSPDKGQVEVNLRFEEGSIALMVRDEGVGIPEDELDKLFTIFHRARNVGQIQGTGLGLAIVKQAVEAHGGTIAVESAVGIGTTFSVVFPT